jgi:hypothetical protein
MREINKLKRTGVAANIATDPSIRHKSSRQLQFDHAMIGNQLIEADFFQIKDFYFSSKLLIQKRYEEMKL